MSILEKRDNYKPFEYPEVQEYIDLINKTFWVHSEINFTADIQDFKSNLSSVEKEILKRSMLSVAQVEVGVKTFWGDLYRLFPKPEFNNLGSTFAESEVRHSEAYSRLLDVLDYNDEFINLLKIPVFKNKLDFIRRNLETPDPLKKLIFFTLVIENSSLFSQFANLISFTRFKGYMKNISNIVAWSAQDEQVHANAGIFIINSYIRELGININSIAPWEYIIKAYIKQEEDLLDWIFETGELSFYTKNDLLNFIKYRLDNSLISIGINPIFNIQSYEIAPMKWFEEEVFANSLDDFFAKRPVDYTKHDKSISKDDLF
jgi:ribonucleoside-diphosphate reductase beta chain